MTRAIGIKYEKHFKGFFDRKQPIWTSVIDVCELVNVKITLKKPKTSSIFMISVTSLKSREQTIIETADAICIKLLGRTILGRDRLKHTCSMNRYRYSLMWKKVLSCHKAEALHQFSYKAILNIYKIFSTSLQQDPSAVLRQKYATVFFFTPDFTLMYIMLDRMQTPCSTRYMYISLTLCLYSGKNVCKQKPQYVWVVS